MTFPNATGHIKDPVLTDSMIVKIIILPNLDIERRLLKKVLEVPHICDDESCRGNSNRKKLEILEEIVDMAGLLDGNEGGCPYCDPEAAMYSHEKQVHEDWCPLPTFKGHITKARELLEGGP